ncbi:MAG: SDR family NAD(P)-dependent oxidoreductase [Acidimicrobiales bacterium]
MQLDETTFAQRYGPWGIVAGASNGIGAAYARSMAKRGLNVVLMARRGDALAQTADEIEASYRVETRVLVADLTSADVLDRVGEATADLDIGLMVYNAGAVHGVARYLDQQVRDPLYLVDLSCRGPVLWTHHFGRRLRARRRGGMVLMSSMSGLVGSALTVTYSATKAFDINLAEGLAIELAPYGVDVMAVVAGLTRTPTMVDSGARLEGFPMMEPDEVSEEAFDALGSGSVLVSGDNKERFDMIRAAPRAEAVEWMSQGAAFMYHVEWPLGE